MKVMFLVQMKLKQKNKNKIFNKHLKVDDQPTFQNLSGAEKMNFMIIITVNKHKIDKFKIKKNLFEYFSRTTINFLKIIIIIIWTERVGEFNKVR